MQGYVYNKACECVRCRMRGLMGPAVLITLGIVFLSGRPHYLPAALLIVIGVVLLLQSNAPTEGHVQPYVLVTPAQGAPATPPTTQPTQPTEPAKEDPHASL
jgi:hypothetical protein